MSKKYKKQENVFEYDSEKYNQKKEALTSFFLDKRYSLMTFKQIINSLNIKSSEVPLIEKILENLQSEGIIYLDESKRYILCSKQNMIKCIYQAKTERFGFGLIQEGSDIYIPSKFSLDAIDKDEILVKVETSLNANSKRKEGKVIKVLKRNTSIIVGRYIENKNFGFVEPIDSKIQDIYISKKYSIGYRTGQIVQVEILKYALGNSKMEGKIISVIGDNNTPNIEVKALEISYCLDKMKEFSKEVLEETEKIPDSVYEAEKKGRIDKTNERAFTIDSEDAKDLDDAICVKKTEDGKYSLSVFIADVSNYVKEKTALDKEAIARGTSIYIPGTVIPMLPKKLSNGICSLNAGVERLALAIDIIFDNYGNVIENSVYKAVIKVTKKMSYEKVYKTIMKSDEEVLKEYAPYIEDINLMKELAIILKKKRDEMGSINFNIAETQIVLDEDSNVVSIKPYDTNISNSIIEEFMLAANMSIAEKFFFLDLPFIYRIHEKPDEEKLVELNMVLANYKKRIKDIKNIHPKSLATIIDEIEDPEEKQVISRYMLRTLKLARYSPDCEGHFGLAAKYYCHFTSPIRRYPDLFIHRIISDYIESGYNFDSTKINKYTKQSQIYAKTSSDAEKQSTVIERDFDDLYIALYMSSFVGHEFDAVVSTIASFGMFVKLENTAEGLVPFDNMPDNDYFIYDETRRILVGKDTGKVFKVGDKIKVKLVKSDVKSKRLDFEVVSGV
ncbi:MAG: ribonuclease R [Clostridia bacterium]